jgi:predicted phosphate transport protein (TIGR00153 family)
MNKQTPFWKKINFRDIFKRKPNRFIELLSRQAELTEQGMIALAAYLEKPNKRRADVVDNLEGEADEVRRILIDELNRTFVTPFDREDIHSLSRTIDDMLDYAYTTVVEMGILEVEPNNYMREISTLLTKAAHELHLGVQRLGDHPGVAQGHAVRVKQVENQVENIYREAIADLFHQPEDAAHIVRMLKYRECYRHLSNAADRGDEAANALSDIVVKLG